jgi:hypothetical protein
VFSNFPTAPMILNDAFANQKEVFAVAGTAPKTVVYMHVNDTFGTAMAKGVGLIMPKYNLPHTIVEEIAYDPTARDLSVEIAKAKTTGSEALMVVDAASLSGTASSVRGPPCLCCLVGSKARCIPAWVQIRQNYAVSQ